MKKSPFISIVLPSYNSARVIGQTIESVLAQTYGNFELLIIDDCSCDDTYKIILEYQKRDKRIKIFRNEKNCGVAYSRNFGVFQAISDWIAFIDSDDLWCADKLEKQVDIINKDPEVEFIFTGVSFIKSDGTRYNYTMSVPPFVTFKRLLKQNIIVCSSVVIKKDWIRRFPMHSDQAHEDFIEWLTLLKHGIKNVGLDEQLVSLRIFQKSSKSGKKLKSVYMTYKSYQTVGLNFFSRIYYMCFYIFKSLFKYGSIKIKK